MPHATGVVMGVVSHRVCAADPTHEPTHITVDQRPETKVIVVRHQLVREQIHLMNRERLTEDLFECGIIGVFVLDLRAKVNTAESMVQSARFIRPRSSWHGPILCV